MPLHPKAQEFLDAIAAQGGPSWEDISPNQGREAFAGLIHLFGKGPELPRIENLTLVNDVSARIYYPREQDSLPILMYFHGGGWVLGDLDTHDALCRHLAQESGFATVAVNYRRPPEHPFPAALNDCFGATEEVINQADSLALDPTCVAVAGDSAGGNLAAAVTLKARDTKAIHLRAQILIYPVIEPQFETESYLNFAEGHGLSRATMQWFWQQYAGAGTAQIDKYAAPGRAESFADLPPAYVLTAEYDVLREEGESYAARLQKAGVPVTVHRYDGMLHGFVHFNGFFDQGKEAIAEIGSALRSITSRR